MRTIGAMLLATTLVASNAFAATNSVAPLASGKPAGVKEANLFGPNSGLILIGAAIVITGLALSLSNTDKGVTSPTTSSTSTSGLP
jgi:hypothetical protein